MSLRGIAVKTRYVTDSSYAQPLDTFGYLTRKRDITLELTIHEYLYKWERLIRKLRPHDNFDDIVSETTEIVMRRYDYDDSTLEAYVKATARSVPIRERRLNDSIDRMIQFSEGEVSLIDTLTDDNKLGSDAHVYNLGRGHFSVQNYREELLWSQWLNDLREQDNSELKLTSEDVIVLVNMCPYLDSLVSREFDELQDSQMGILDRKNYKRWFNEVLISICNNFKYTKSHVRKHLPTWLSLYLQNQEVLKRQFVLMVDTDIKEFSGLRETALPCSAEVLDDVINIKAKKWYNLFKLDLDPIIDKVFDDYFDSKYPSLSFELNGETFYNVLGGIFVAEGDLRRYISESICEYVLSCSKMMFVLMTDKAIYFENRLAQRDLMYYWYYFGVNFSLHLEFVGKTAYIEGEKI